MTEPKLLTDDGLKWLRERTRPLHVRERELLFAHIVALQQRADAGAEALRVVSAIETLLRHHLVQAAKLTQTVYHLSAITPGYGHLYEVREHGLVASVSALEQAVAAKEPTNAAR